MIHAISAQDPIMEAHVETAIPAPPVNFATVHQAIVSKIRGALREGIKCRMPVLAPPNTFAVYL